VRISRILPALMLALSVGTIAPIAQAANEIEQHLRYEFRDKTFLLRGFYPGNALHYSPDGVLREPTQSGDWTVDGGVRIDDLSVSGSRLRIKASRVRWGWVTPIGFSPLHDSDGKGHPDKDEKKNRALQIEVDLGSDPRLESAEAAFSRIFLNSKDNFGDLIPDYWKPCVSAALKNGGDIKFQSCRFSAEFLQIPGVQPPSEGTPNSEAKSDSQNPVERPAILSVGHGVSPPRVLNQQNPSFSEPARRAKYQGIVVLGLIVDKSGSATHIHIQKPLGYGLDENAVHSVEGWRFKPAEKDGQPVATEIAVEVDFHLY